MAGTAFFRVLGAGWRNPGLTEGLGFALPRRRLFSLRGLVSQYIHRRNRLTNVHCIDELAALLGRPRLALPYAINGEDEQQRMQSGKERKPKMPVSTRALVPGPLSNTLSPIPARIDRNAVAAMTRRRSIRVGDKSERPLTDSPEHDHDCHRHGDILRAGRACPEENRG